MARNFARDSTLDWRSILSGVGVVVVAAAALSVVCLLLAAVMSLVFV